MRLDTTTLIISGALRHEKPYEGQNRCSLTGTQNKQGIIRYFLRHKAIIEEAIMWASPFILSHISIFKRKHSLGSAGAILTRVEFHRVVFNVCSAVKKTKDKCGLFVWLVCYIMVTKYFIPL